MNPTDATGAHGEDPGEAGRSGAPDHEGHALPPREAALWILWNAFGTHADVRAAPPGSREGPARAHPLSPGDAYHGIPFEEWARRVGQTVDVLALQARWSTIRERERRALPVSLRVKGDEWSVDTAAATTSLPASEYGFATGLRAVACSREQLIRQCVAVPETPAVWTPATPGTVPPETVPFLVEALRARRRTAAESGVATAGIALLVGAVLAWSVAGGARSLWVVVLAIAAAWFAAMLYEYRHARRAGGEAFVEARQNHRHAVWIEARSPVYTRVLLLVLAAVMAAESFGIREAIDAAGLVKPRVREGEVWRLLTGTLLHGGLLHVALNLLALWSLGPLVEAHARRAALPTLFLASALVGSVTSLLLVPGQPSVGASGGILGLAGFLFLHGYRTRHALPAGFVRRIGLGILATAVFGLVGYAFVDNATHLGGLVTGMALAFVLPIHTAASPLPSSRSLDLLGRATLAVLVLGALGSVALIYQALSRP